MYLCFRPCNFSQIATIMSLLLIRPTDISHSLIRASLSLPSETYKEIHFHQRLISQIHSETERHEPTNTLPLTRTHAHTHSFSLSLTGAHNLSVLSFSPSGLWSSIRATSSLIFCVSCSIMSDFSHVQRHTAGWNCCQKSHKKEKR